MRLVVLLCSLLLALVGCQSASVDKALQSNLPKICSGANNIHLAFIAASTSGKVSDAVIAKEKAAYQAMQNFCANPSSVNSQNALIAAAQAYADYIRATKGGG